MPTATHHNNYKAILAIAKASLTTILRSPSAVLFSFAFPLIFILAFGFFGNRNIAIKIGFDSKVDTLNPIIKSLKANPAIKIVDYSRQNLLTEFNKGKIGALVSLTENQNTLPKYQILVKYNNVATKEAAILRPILNDIILQLNTQNTQPKIANVSEQNLTVKEFKPIDFILPGQLGFALLSAGVFGTAFAFISLRVSLIIKRFFATPVRKIDILLGETISRIIFSLSGAIFIIAVGHFFLDFTLINGWITFAYLILLSAIGLIVFMGFGFVISGIAKNEHAVPPLANIITMPQFLLSGTFIPIESFPKWMQPICNLMPLTYLNDALRKIAFDGENLLGVMPQIGILILWGIIIYAIAVKFFRWE